MLVSSAAAAVEPREEEAAASQRLEASAITGSMLPSTTGASSYLNPFMSSELFGLPMQVYSNLNPMHATRTTYLPVTLSTTGYRKRIGGSSDQQIASIFAEPSAYLQQVIRNKSSSSLTSRSDLLLASPTKKPRYLEAQSCDYLTLRPPQPFYDPLALHKACRLPHTSEQVLQQLLQADPGAAARPYHDLSRSTPHPFCHDPGYTYPINLAMAHGLKPPALALLIQAAPQVLTLPDGPHSETTLHVLLHTRPKDTPTLLLLLLSRPQLASMSDNRGNDPIMLAQQQGASAEAISYLSIVAEAAAGVAANDMASPSTRSSASQRSL